MSFSTDLDFAKNLDREDTLASFRDRFLFPRGSDGKPVLYLTGNSLGLQPKQTREYVEQELADWETYAVGAHFKGKTPWYSYHETTLDPLAALIGGKTGEAVAMNSLTTNLNSALISFYQPTSSRNKILVEPHVFPSDRYAIEAHIRLHGYDPKECLLIPDEAGMLYKNDDICSLVERNSESLACILIGDVNYLTGQACDVPRLAEVAGKLGIPLGLDLAHGAGNLNLKLHEWGVDFAVWCHYKYMNSGPGAIGGFFIHEKHAKDFDRPRLAGWWGHDKDKRFEMRPEFSPMKGAEGFQLSNPPILQLAALRSSLDIFLEAGMDRIGKKRDLLTGYLEYLLREWIPEDKIQQITPSHPEQRGSQLSYRLKGLSGEETMKWVQKKREEGIICDFRMPDILRLAPMPLYNQFEEVHHFASLLRDYVQE